MKSVSFGKLITAEAAHSGLKRYKIAPSFEFFIEKCMLILIFDFETIAV